MNKAKIFLLINFALLALTTGCQRSSGEVWEDSKTASRYMGRGVKSIAGKHGDSRQIGSRDEFGICSNEQDFVPMDGLAISEREGIPQSRLSPGEGGVPGIDAFRDPSADPQLAGVFRNMHFDYNSDLVKGQENLMIAKEIATFMKKNPSTYIFVEGHCDERGPQSYNFALGSNRSNSVRNLLAQEGVNMDNVFTISYGKERPLIETSNEVSWSQNRRAQFKVYAR
jgi:peptidoglycan-associated lipoprotein